MLRVVKSKDVYYSLTDVVALLCRERVLTEKQGCRFTDQVYQYVSNELAAAYSSNTIFLHQVPVILPLEDYFIHWILWANLLMLLPDGPRSHGKVDELNLLLDDPEALEKHPELFEEIELVLVSKISR